MNIKESIISSSFIHLILILLIVAASTYTTGISGGLQNMISVDLTMEEKDLPEAGNETAEEPALTPDLPPSEEVSLSDQAAPPEELKETPEPEKKAETVTEPVKKIENTANPPAQTGGFTSMEAYYQFMMMHKKIFGQKAGARVNELLGEAFKVNKRHFYGGTAIVSLKFGADGNLREALVDSTSPELKAFLEEISWSAVPAPAQYSLKFTGVKIEFTVLEGSMSFKIDML
jgi:hypothetical protein